MEFGKMVRVNSKTVAKVAQAEQIQRDGWFGVRAGADILIDNRRFQLTSVEPSHNTSEYAWLKGKFITGSGKPAKGYLSHLHCAEGEREEFVHIDRVRVFL